MGNRRRRIIQVHLGGTGVPFLGDPVASTAPFQTRLQNPWAPGLTVTLMSRSRTGGGTGPRCADGRWARDSAEAGWLRGTVDRRVTAREWGRLRERLTGVTARWRGRPCRKGYGCGFGHKHQRKHARGGGGKVYTRIDKQEHHFIRGVLA